MGLELWQIWIEQKGVPGVEQGSLRLHRAAEISALCCICTWFFLFYAAEMHVVAGPLLCSLHCVLRRLVLCPKDSLLCSAMAFSATWDFLGTTVLPHPYHKGQDFGLRPAFSQPAISRTDNCSEQLATGMGVGP